MHREGVVHCELRTRARVGVGCTAFESRTGGRRLNQELASLWPTGGLRNDGCGRRLE